jgi:hypothetical protein
MIGNDIYQHAGGKGAAFTDANDAFVICNRVQGAAGSGIAMNNAMDFVALGNQVSGANRGFEVTASQDFVVNGNLSSQNREGVAIDAGESGGSGALVSNNLVSENAKYGVYSYNYGNSIVATNLAINTGTSSDSGYGLHITGKPGQAAAHLIINANESIDTRTSPYNYQKYGLRIENLAEPLVSDNVLLNANTYDLSVGTGVTDLNANDNLALLAQMSSPGNCSEVIAAGHRLAGDIDGDCRIDLNDIAVLVVNWLACNDPKNGSCIPNWPH